MSGRYFSVVVLARNEAHVLPRLLAGLRDFIDGGGDVLLADTGSSDDSVAIARAAGCRVEVLGDAFDSILTKPQRQQIEERFSREGELPLVRAGDRLFHFAEARQRAGELAAKPFVFQLDAGDEILAFDVEKLDQAIEAGAAALEYEHVTGNVTTRVARFYDRGRYHWQGRVHEGLFLSAPDAGATRTRCDPTQLRIRHHKDEKKPRSYLAGLALQVIDTPEKPRWWHYLGRELMYDRWFYSAIAALEQHAMMAEAWSAERSQSLCFVGECYEGLELFDQAKDAYHRAAALDSTRREPLLRLATLASRHHDFATAVEAAQAALAIPHTSAYAEVESNYTWRPHATLYWCLFWLGRKEEARVHWEQYLALIPEEYASLHHARLFPPTK